MRSYKTTLGDVDEHEMQTLIRTRMMQNVMWDRVNQGLDAIAVYRFQAAGLLKRASARKIPSIVADVLERPAHPLRVAAPDGPLLFYREDKQVTVIDVISLLLSPTRRIRAAVIRYLTGARSTSAPWLTPRSIELVSQRAPDCKSDQPLRWREAVVDMTIVLRDDVFGHLAALRQSIDQHYPDGISQYFYSLTRPSFQSLAHVRPPVWSASEQRDHIEQCIRECASLPTLTECLTSYVNKCGYLPLSDSLDAAEVANQWSAQHGRLLDWDEVWCWAVASTTPVAKYHACTIGLRLASAGSNTSLTKVIAEIVNILDLHESEDEPTVDVARWWLHCELGSHFAFHIDALHPGQDGERIACYAWWLAQKVGESLGGDINHVREALKRIAATERELSFTRWTIARSPVIPSPLRYATLFTNSVWAMSLLGKLTRASATLPRCALPEEMRRTLAKVMRGYLVGTTLARSAGTTSAVFAFQDKLQMRQIVERSDLVWNEDRPAITALLEYNEALADTSILRHLEGFLELPFAEQYLFLLSFREELYSSTRFDEAVSEWLAKTDGVIDMLLHVPGVLVGILVDALAQFHERQRGDLRIRLPHLVVHAIESADEIERVRLLSVYTLLMSTGAGIASPIQRVLACKWRKEVFEPVTVWRHNVMEIVRYSEPWVAGRVRAACAAISRAIGPTPPQKTSSKTSGAVP